MVIYQYDTDVVNKINAPIVKIVSEQRFWWTETALRIAKSNPPTLFTFIISQMTSTAFRGKAKRKAM